MSITRSNGTVEFAGRVLDIGVTVDSLWETDRHYAVVLTDAGAIEQVETGSRHWGGASSTSGLASIDATTEVIAAAREIIRKARLEALAGHALFLAKTVAKGKVVRVVKGRKVAVGTEGEVVWTGVSTYGVRVGIKTAAGVEFTAQDNVVVADPMDHVTHKWDQLEAIAAAEAARSYPEAQAALLKRQAEGTGEFAVDPFRKEMERAVTEHLMAQPVETATCLHCDAAVERQAESGRFPGVCEPCAEKMLEGEMTEEGVCIECKTADARPGSSYCPACNIRLAAGHPLVLEALAKAFIAMAGPERAAKVLVRECGYDILAASLIAARIEEVA